MHRRRSASIILFIIIFNSHRNDCKTFLGRLCTVALGLHKQTFTGHRYSSECWSYARYCAECNKNIKLIIKINKPHAITVIFGLA